MEQGDNILPSKCVPIDNCQNKCDGLLDRNNEPVTFIIVSLSLSQYQDIAVFRMNL